MTWISLYINQTAFFANIFNNVVCKKYDEGLNRFTLFYEINAKKVDLLKLFFGKILGFAKKIHYNKLQQSQKKTYKKNISNLFYNFKKYLKFILQFQVFYFGILSLCDPFKQLDFVPQKTRREYEYFNHTKLIFKYKTSLTIKQGNIKAIFKYIDF
ncbi:MAG: hypothetical protein CR967_02515 [Proteobacteria bacterium]|nr:MAG: hypothetical protein CR967_02515 [Pseudomonadota bacterium]